MTTLLLAASLLSWPAATQDAKPWVYNWWMGSAVDEKGLEAQCAALEEGGFGGFHVIPIYEAKGWEAKTRRMDCLSTWSRNDDGSECAFSGTMRYRTTFDLKSVPSGAILDLSEVRDSTVVRVNGREAGFSFMAPFRVKIPAEALRTGENEVEVDVTSVGANRIRWNDRMGVKWKYFKDANVIAYGYTGPFDASKWPLRDCGLLGPVRLVSVR